jgi:hypothetical protein
MLNRTLQPERRNRGNIMADITSTLSAFRVGQPSVALNPAVFTAFDGLSRVPPRVITPLPPQPPAATPAPPVLPPAPTDNPFENLPFPSPGDRIRADDFKRLSQALKVIVDMTALSASLFGRTFSEAKAALLGHGYQIARVMTVFGTEIDNLADSSLDGRKVVQTVPAELGLHQVMVIVSEAVDTRRFVPNLMGLTYPDAQERVKTLVGEPSPGSAPPTVPQLVGLGLGDVQQAISK